MKLKEIYQYTGVLYAVNLTTSVIAFTVMILVSRAIAKEDLGMYGLYQAHFLLAAYASGLGMNQAIVKHVAEQTVDRAQIHTLLAIVIGSMFVVLASVGAFVIRFNEILGIALIALPAYHVFDFSLCYARGLRWRRVEASILLLGSIATSVCVLGLLQVNQDHRGPIYGQVTGLYLTALSLIGVFFYSQRSAGMRFAPIRGDWVKGFALVAAPMFVTALLIAIGEVTDRFLIERYLGLAVLAEYFIAMTLYNILDRPLGYLARVLLSHFCGKETTEIDPTQHLDSLRQLVKFNVLVFPVFALLVIAILPGILDRLFNKDYSIAFEILALVSVIVVAKAFEVVNSMLAIAKNNAKSNMYSQLGSVMVYLPLVVFLIKTFGIFGAAAGIVLRWVVFALYQFMHMKRMNVATVPVSLLLRSLAAYALALAFFPVAPWAMAFVYLLVGAVLRLWSRDDFARYLPGMRAAAARAPEKP